MTGIVNGEPQQQPRPWTQPLAGCWCGGKCPHADKPNELERTNRRDQAEMAWRRVLLEVPECVEANKALARILVMTTHPRAAGGYLESAIATAGLTPELALSRAHNLRAQVKLDEALTAAFDALSLAPDDPAAHVYVAVVYQARGEIQHMGAAVDSAVKKFGEVTPLRHIRAQLAIERQDFQQAVEILTDETLTPSELFDRGRAKERLADYPGAWSDWMAAKAIQRAHGRIYPAARVRAIFAAHQEMARPARIKLYRRGAARSYDASHRPLFITGFPRSGTTMIEAVLSRHSQIAAGDEMPFLNDLVDRIPRVLNVAADYPKAMMGFAWRENETAAELLASWYIGLARQKIGDDFEAPFFTDKMLSNEVHLPLIGLLFPGSPVVHVRRHPLDILVSNMSHSLVHGRCNACALEWCATHYALVDQLLARYRDALELLAVRLHEVRYESFVADATTTTRLLLSACGLSFEPDCVAFHEAKFHSRTLSHRQIKAPLHAGAIGRYRPFLDFLKPVLPTLRDTMEREGYAV